MDKKPNFLPVQRPDVTPPLTSPTSSPATLCTYPSLTAPVSSQTGGTLMPQGLCTDCSPCLEHSPHTCVTDCVTHFRSVHKVSSSVMASQERCQNFTFSLIAHIILPCFIFLFPTSHYWICSFIYLFYHLCPLLSPMRVGILSVSFTALFSGPRIVPDT